MKWLYLLLCVVGIALPMNALMPWLLSHGLDVPAFIDAITRSRVASFGWLDLLVSAVVFFVFVRVEGKRLGMQKLWIPVLATCFVGLSFGLPLFLFMREWRLDSVQSEAAEAQG